MKRKTAATYNRSVTERVSNNLKYYNINLFNKISISIGNEICWIKDVSSFDEKKNLVYK